MSVCASASAGARKQAARTQRKRGRREEWLGEGARQAGSGNACSTRGVRVNGRDEEACVQEERGGVRGRRQVRQCVRAVEGAVYAWCMQV